MKLIVTSMNSAHSGTVRAWETALMWQAADKQCVCVCVRAVALFGLVVRLC